jgi:beta-glucosidase-like glycosyl hydrolase
MRRAVYLLSVLLLAGCGSRVASTSPSVTPKPSVEFTTSPAAPAAPAAAGNQDAALGPAGMTLQQEIGAVMMVGFPGPLTPAVLEDWRQHQFGGLIVVAINHNGGDATAIRQLIQSVRGVMRHPLMAATNPEGGAGQSGPAATSRGLKALGFDITLASVADARDVTAAIADIHAAGMYAVAQSSTDFRVVVAAHVEFIVVGHLTVPSIAVPKDLGYQGVIISDDLQLQAPGPEYPPPAAAVRFLKNGGDMVIVSRDLAVADATYAAIHAAVLNGMYPRAQLDASVQKLLSLGLRYMP